MNQISNLTYSDVILYYKKEENQDSWNSLNNRLATLNNQLKSSRSQGRRWNIHQEISSIEHKIRTLFPVRQIIPATVGIEGSIDNCVRRTPTVRVIYLKKPTILTEPKGLFGFTRKQTIIGGAVILVVVAASAFFLWGAWRGPSSSSQSNSGNSGGDGGGKIAPKGNGVAAAAAAAVAAAEAMKKAAQDFVHNVGSILDRLKEHDLEWLKNKEKISEAVYQYLKYVRDEKNVSLVIFCAQIRQWKHDHGLGWLLRHKKLYL